MVKAIVKGKCRTCYARELRGGKPRRRVLLADEIAGLLLPVDGTSGSFAERVLTYVDPSGDCWEWTGTKDRNGYGVIGRGVRGAGNVSAHRAVWNLLVGAIPEGMHYDHLCRNHGCANPDHGEIVTPEENKCRGYGISVLHARRDKCGKGHPLDGRLGVRGGQSTGRYCKTCKREAARTLRAA